MVNNAISALSVDAPAVTTHNPMATRRKSVNASFAPITSAAVCAVCRAPLASLDKLSPLGSKKETSLPELRETLIEPDPAEPATMVLELDELWSFVLKRSNKRWVWIALSRATRQVVAYVVGDRSAATGRKLWQQIPAAYRRAHCYSDFWEAYRKVIPVQQHTAAGKETGLTAHVERWNNTLRQRLGRFVRKSLSFSKSDAMHELCLRLFLHDYNLSLALFRLSHYLIYRGSIVLD
jgi:insertion element IS1 protein InsB